MSMWEFMTQEACANDILTAHYYCFRPADSELMRASKRCPPLTSSFSIDNTVIDNKQYNLDVQVMKKAGFT